MRPADILTLLLILTWIALVHCANNTHPTSSFINFQTGMFKRKLLALDHANAASLNIDDDNEFRTTVLWLEDRKIRHYKIEDRIGLRKTDNADVWLKAFKQYLTDLQCPYHVETHARVEIFDWLLGFAVRLEYGDNMDKYQAKDSTSPKNNASPGSGANPLDNIDFNSADVKAGVASLAQLLHIPPHPNHLEVLKAICLVVQDKFSQESIEKAKLSVGKKDVVSFENIQLGFDGGDYVSNDAAKILRVLHVRNLRDLQSQINTAIVAVQAITADPKTDTRLGKVGR